MKIALLTICVFKAVSADLNAASTDSLPFFFPDSDFETFKVIALNSFKQTTETDALQIATEEICKRAQIPSSSLKITDFHQDNYGVWHIYATLVLEGKEVDNNHASIHLTSNGDVQAFSSSFRGEPVKSRSIEKTLSMAEAESIAVETYGIPRNEHPSEVVYFETKSGQLALAFKIQIRDDSQYKWYQVVVNASNGEILSVINFYKFVASFNVLKIPDALYPLNGFTTVFEPQHRGSPKGWVFDRFTTGNNADSESVGLRVDGGQTLSFNSTWDVTQGPKSLQNLEAGIINSFYITNIMHDISYEYGFDEKAGNFQVDNFDNGGLGNDSVLIHK